LIDPVIFTIKIGNFALPIYWYGVIVVTGIIVATFLTQKEVERHNENPEIVWDALIWMLILGIIGARLWYVVNDIGGGSRRFLEEPLQILNVRAGGLHIYGAFLVGAIGLVYFARRHKIDLRLFLDAVAPGLLLGQGIGRVANFINQELYGPPTTLPWGVTIAPQNRIPPWNNLTTYPPETRFHPTFFYELIWNFLAAGLLLWVWRKYEKKVKPTTIFAGWLILAGGGRFVLEWWRPDQPTIPGTAISYSRIVAGVLFISGVITLLVRYKKINIPWFNLGPDSYKVRKKKSGTKKAGVRFKKEEHQKEPKGEDKKASS
jgi:phosphatidylglycerol:prolipoprotein diacylglycerol transferase